MAKFYGPVDSQWDVGAAALTDVYVCPTDKTVRGTLSVCNRDPVTTTIRIAIAQGGANDDVKQYLVYDQELLGNTTYFLEDITLNETDVIRVETAVSNVSAGFYVEEVRNISE